MQAIRARKLSEWMTNVGHTPNDVYAKHCRNRVAYRSICDKKDYKEALRECASLFSCYGVSPTSPSPHLNPSSHSNLDPAFG